MIKDTFAFAAILLASIAFADPKDDVDALLSAMHKASKDADVSYFDLFADDAVFFGTDLWERWTKDEFEALYKPYMESGRGWEFKMRDRRIDVQAGDDFALFDEVLFSDSYGPCRGSGAARLDDGEWKIVRYHLDITIPNDAVDEIIPIASAWNEAAVRFIEVSAKDIEVAQLASMMLASKPDVVYIQDLDFNGWREFPEFIHHSYTATDNPFGDGHIFVRQTGFLHSVSFSETRFGQHEWVEITRDFGWRPYHIMFANPDSGDAGEAALKGFQDMLGPVLVIRNGAIDTSDTDLLLEVEDAEIAGVPVKRGTMIFYSEFFKKRFAE